MYYICHKNALCMYMHLYLHVTIIIFCLIYIRVCVCVCVCFVCYYLNKPTFTFQTASDAQDINEAGLNSQHLQTLLYIEAKDANNCADRSRRVLCPNISICFKWTLNHL